HSLDVGFSNVLRCWGSWRSEVVPDSPSLRLVHPGRMMPFQKSLWALTFLLAGSLAAGAQQSPAAKAQGEGWEEVAPPTEAEPHGQKVFVANCSFCHGTDGSGKTGPDLLRSALVNHDQGGNQIGVVVHNGRPNTPMPPFPNLTDAEIADISAFLHRQTKAV